MTDHLQSARKALAADIERRWAQIDALMRDQATAMAQVRHLDLLIGTPAPPAAAPDNAAPSRAKAPLAPTPAREPGGRTVRVILEALEAAPDGVLGGELNALVAQAGLSLDAAEKAKARLREARMITYDRATKIWRLTASAGEQLR